MKITLFCRLAAVFLLVFTASFAVLPSPVQATSDFDDVIITGHPTVTCGSEEVDLGATYESVIRNAGNSYYNSVLDDALQEGKGIILTQGYNPGSSNTLALFVSTTPATATASFYSSSYPGGWLGGQNVVRATIQCGEYAYPSTANVLYVDFNTTSATREVAMNLGVNGGYRPVFSTMPVVYPASPTDYDGIGVANSEPKAEYVAMGDSYSSGEGNPSFITGTDDASNDCHRSKKAYPYIVQSDLDLDSMLLVACSGATTSQVLNGASGHGAWSYKQIDALSDETQKVTITIGGNDVEFAEYATMCSISTCTVGTFDYNYIMAAIADSDFHDALVDTYKTIIDKAPLADVYVGDYPYMTPEDSDCGGDIDLSAAWNVQNALNAVIENAVEDAATETLTGNLHYVPTNDGGSPFEEHYLCGGEEDSDFNGLVLPPNAAYSYHPNESGHQHYAEVFVDAMS